jgi:hypothetical protein
VAEWVFRHSVDEFEVTGLLFACGPWTEKDLDDNIRKKNPLFEFVFVLELELALVVALSLLEDTSDIDCV